MKLTFTSFPKFNFWDINLTEICFSNFEKMQKNAIFIFQKINFLNHTFHTQSLGRKGHWNFVFWFFSFFFFSIKSKKESQIPISIFNKNWKKNFCSFFHEIVSAPNITSPKLPLKKESFHLFSIFQKLEHKTQILIFV